MHYQRICSVRYFLEHFLKTHSQGLAVLYKVCQYAIRIYLLTLQTTYYILHMSSKIVCVYEIFFQCPPEMEVMTKTNSVKSVAYLGRVSPWRHENIERKKSSSRKWSLSPENGITYLAPIVLPSFVISISTALMASNGYLSREYDKKNCPHNF